MTVSTINMLEFLEEIVCLELGLVGGIRGVLPVDTDELFDGAEDDEGEHIFPLLKR